ncbi:MAG: hypothetical protein AAF514_21665, partial [Verrucomicrobiota bacterium]
AKLPIADVEEVPRRLYLASFPNATWLFHLSFIDPSSSFQSASSFSSLMDFRAYLKEAVPYWESGRLIYNLVLLTLVAIFWGPDMIKDPPHVIAVGCLLILLPLAIVSNLLYCAAYPADLVGQYLCQATGLKKWTTPFRFGLFGSGLATASILALYILAHPDPGH